MNKLESTIPFDGFYESFISADIEHQMGQQIEWDCDLYDLNEFEEEILYNNYLTVNTSYFYNQIAEDYTNFYIDELHFYESLTETIIFNLGNTLDKEGIDLLDKKQKEKDRKELMDKQQLKLNFN